MSSSRNAILVTAVCALVEQAHAACMVPSSTTGYTIGATTGQNLDPSSFVSPSVTCDASSGYGPTGTGPTAVACGADNTVYTFAGCTRACIAPAAGTTGYSIGGSADHNSWSATVTCASDYHSTGSGPAITQCSAAGQEYGVSGCAADECVRPSSGVVGIDFSGATETLTKWNFSVTGLSCATGYTGSATLNGCSADGAEYGINNNCAELTCTGYADNAAMPTGYVQGSSYAETALTGPTLAIADVECAAGYTGTPQAATCTSQGSGYVLTGCSAETSNSFASRVSAGSQVALLVGALVSAVLVF